MYCKENSEKIKKMIKEFKIRVILMGSTGAGKSSLTNALSSNGKLTIISFLVFKDTGGFLQVIVNNFAIYCLLSDNKRFKILLIATEDEIYNFSNYNQIKNEIMKGDIAQFFTNNPDRVFVFPKPLKCDIGKEYKFGDHDVSISFLEKNPIVNPKLQSEADESALINLIKIYDKEISKIIETITDKINIQFRKEDNLEKMIRIIVRIRNFYIKNVNKFQNIIKVNIPNYVQYIEMKSLTEFEVFDRFIDKVLIPNNENNEKPLIIKQIQEWAKQSICELKLKKIKYQMKLITAKMSSPFIYIKNQEVDKLIIDMNKIIVDIDDLEEMKKKTVR